MSPPLRPSLAPVALVAALLALLASAPSGSGCHRGGAVVGSAPGLLRLLSIASQDPALAGRVRPLTVGGSTRRALRASDAFIARIPVTIPEGATLAFSYGVTGPPAPSGAYRFDFAVRAEIPGGEVVPLFRSTVRPGPLDPPGWRSARVPLDALAGRAVHLAFAVSRGDPGTGLPPDPTLRVPAWGTVRLEYPPDPPDPRPDLLFVLVDTLRADHVGAYGYGRPTTPRIDALAREGTTFLEARSQAPWTAHSVRALFTGLYPRIPSPERGARDWIDPSAKTLAEQLALSGYRCEAFVNNPHVSPEMGFAAGFERFTYLESDEQVLEAVLGSVDEPSSRPRFRYVHFIGPHLPYELVEPWASTWGHPRLEGREVVAQTRAELAEVGATPGGLERMVAAYDSAIARTDVFVGMIADRLAERGRLDRTVVVVTSDHGEELGEHGGWEHGHALYNEVLHVPLVVRAPGIFPAGERVAWPVEQFGLMPTLLRLAGARPIDPVQAPDLLPLEPLPDGDPVACRFAGNLLYGEQAVSLACPDGKAIHHVESGRMEVYDRRADPGESVDLFAAAPDPATELARWTARIRARTDLFLGEAFVLRADLGGGKGGTDLELSSPGPLTLLSVAPSPPPGSVVRGSDGRTWRVRIRDGRVPTRLAFRGEDQGQPVRVRARGMGLRRRDPDLWIGSASQPDPAGAKGVDLVPATSSRPSPGPTLPDPGQVRLWSEREAGLPPLVPRLRDLQIREWEGADSE